MRKIVDYEWEDIGIEHSQYFQGRGTAYTEWDNVFVGIGMNAQEAIEDTLESAAQSGYDVEEVVIPSIDDAIDTSYAEDDEYYYHVALYVKGE